MLTKTEITAYLNRIGIEEIQAPTRAFLFDLHRAHVANVSWQTLDIYAGRPTSIDVQETVQLMINHRSGYCFHLNGAFAALLRALGYQISWHRAGVQPIGEEPRINSFHLGVTVRLRNETGEIEPWIVDVGLGDMPYEPLPLQFGEYQQGPAKYQVTSSSVAEHGWRLEHDPLHAYAGVDYSPEVVQDLDLFIPNHEYYSRSSDSPWINLFLLRQRHALESNELRGCVWKKWDHSGVESTEIASQNHWLEVMSSIFNERLVTYSGLERDELWKRVKKQHEDWKKLTNK
ncbi:arylamine N-acetyltransferase family protein [Paenibacillus planticolens]|uniref:Arylamine N-acetyltransferase n=1 Tax=Paenibacillus planticolens TaxID=2654976 RepID=A0ABX1ZT10_9BACL|nr:arylamine N-acetyltransferase [Paenibacillus planticolens]NOV02936.1 arylamine N-acetyltransferase [Paenibacillus planticolens]